MLYIRYDHKAKLFYFQFTPGKRTESATDHK